MPCWVVACWNKHDSCLAAVVTAAAALAVECSIVLIFLCFMLFIVCWGSIETWRDRWENNRIDFIVFVYYHYYYLIN